MAIQLFNSRQPDATTAKLIVELIWLGRQYVDIASQSRFYRERRIQEKVAEAIRSCNHFLAMSGSFKNGCLYREAGLAPFWKSGNGEAVVCDHAVPVGELVRQHLEDGVPLEHLILSPVVRLSKDSDRHLTQAGFARQGYESGLPMSRYSKAGIRIVTHDGEEIDAACWTDADHWRLVCNTPELRPVLNGLGID